MHIPPVFRPHCKHHPIEHLQKPAASASFTHSPLLFLPKCALGQAAVPRPGSSRPSRPRQFVPSFYPPLLQLSCQEQALPNVVQYLSVKAWYTTLQGTCVRRRSESSCRFVQRRQFPSSTTSLFSHTACSMPESPFHTSAWMFCTYSQVDCLSNNTTHMLHGDRLVRPQGRDCSHDLAFSPRTLAPPTVH